MSKPKPVLINTIKEEIYLRMNGELYEKDEHFI
jgi:hypothetical protein